MGSQIKDELSFIPKNFNKVYCNSNLVPPPCVPRKLRSAIRKRTCMSSSAPLLYSKRLKHSINDGVESVRKDCLTTFENGCSGSSSRLAISMAISKEEEEVAETLFALAGMIPLKGESSKAKTADLAKNKHDHPVSSSEGPVILKKEPESATHVSSSAAMNAVPAAQGSIRDSIQESSLTETRILSWPQFPESRQLNNNLEISVPAVNLQSIPPSLRACNEMQLKNSARLFQLSAESTWHSGLKEIKLDRAMLPKGQSHISSGAVDVVANQDYEHTTSSERRDNVLASRPLHSSGVNGCPLQSSAVIFPLWPNTIPSPSRRVSHGDAILLDKVSVSANGGRKSWKRCVTHVYLSRLIQAHQTSEGRDNLPLDASQFRSSQYSSLASDLNRINGDLATSHMFGSAAYRNICETGNKVSMKVEHYEDKGGPSSSRRCGSEQGFDFLSLSTGAGPEANNGTDKLHNYMESKDHVLHIHSTAQASASLPCPTAHNRFPSGAYRDQVAVATMALPPVPSQVHMPSYLPNAFALTHMSGTAKSTEQSQPKSQQQQIWAAQLAAQFRPGQLHSSQITNWQNRRQDPHSSTHYVQSHLPPPQPSLDVMGAKYLHLSQQQQQLIGPCPSLPFSNSRPQIGQCPSAYEDKGGRFHTDGVLPLQLLCNEKLS